MKKKMVITIFLIIICCIVLIPNKTYAWSEVKGDADTFIGVGLGQKRKLDISSPVNTAASILTTIGVVIVLGGILILGIRYMTASPQEAAKLKTRAIGLVVSGVVILAAFGIWQLVGNFMLDTAGEIAAVEVTIPEDFDPTATPKATKTPVIPKTTSKPEEGEDPTTEGPTAEEPITEEDKGGMTFVGGNINSWVYVPKINDIKTYKNIPLIIYLHGDDSSISSDKLINQNSVPRYLYKNELKLNALVVSPTNDNADMKALISNLKKEYDIDKNRIYITGHSTGAYAAVKHARDDLDDNGKCIYAACVPMSLRYYGSQNYVLQIKCPATFIFESNHYVYSKYLPGDSHQPEQIDKAIKNVIDSAGKTSLRYIKVQGKSHETVPEYYKESNIFDWILAQSN